jgi:tetratricopeptide (TPR) repeat protein
VLLAALAVTVLASAGCGKRRSLLEPAPRARKAFESLGADEAVARAQSRAQRERSADAYTELAQIYTLANQRRPAREALQQAVKVEPTFAPAAVMLGSIRLEEGRGAAAEKLMRDLLAAHRDVPEAAEILGRALLGQKKVDEAESIVRDALKRHRNIPGLYWVLGDILGWRGQYQGSAVNLARAVALSPKLPELRLAHAQALLGAGDKAAAAQAVQQAVALAPESARVRFLAGTVLCGAGQADEAIAQYREGLVLDPANPALANNMALVLADEQRDTSAAVSWARKAIAAVPQSLAVADTLGWALARDGQLADALPLLRQVHKQWPTNPAVSYHLGWALATSGKRAEGLALLRQAAGGGRNDVAPQAQKALGEFGDRRPASPAG